MSNALTRLENSLATTGKSAIDDLLKQSEVVMLLIDTSGSMEGMMSNGKSRIDGLREVVRDIRGAGDVPMVAFGGPYDAQVRFVDAVPPPDGGTPLHIAIPFAKQYAATRLVVISDGMPDLTTQSLDEAKAFGGKIDVVYVGNPGEGGSVFLDELARITGGKRFEGSLTDTKALSGAVIGLLEGDVAESHAPIQGPGFTAEESIDDAEPVGTEGEDEDEEDYDDEDEDDEA